MTEKLSQIKGVICPLVTPFDESGEIDHAAVRALVDHLLAHGVQVLFPGGSTGEGPLLTIQERKALADTVLDQVAGRAPVIVHTGCATTRETIELTCHAQAAGATAVSVITPYFFTYTEESIFEHYVAMAEAAPDCAIFIYVFPGNAKNDVSPALLRKMRAAAPNIVGVKSSNPDLMRFQEYIDVGGADFVPLCGVDGLMFAGLMVGSRGQVSGNSNAVPELFRDLYAAFAAGNVEEARAMQEKINQARRILGDGLHPAYFKAALTLRGIPAGRVRAPMREITTGEMETLKRQLQEMGIPLA